MPVQVQESEESRERWRKILIEGHRPMLIMHSIFRHLPGPPRCKGCYNPFGGIGGKLAGVLGFTPSRKNPNLCARCCDRLPPGGAEVDIGVLFADVRGSTSIGERLGPAEFASVMNRFYAAATEVLIGRDAIIDKLIGDAVMALFIPGICGPTYRRRAVQAAKDLMLAVGYGPATEPWLPIGAAVHSGVAYVGNVGGEGVLDFTALGDTVNIGARLAQSAAAGEVLLSNAVYDPDLDRGLERRALAIRGREAPIEVSVLRTAG